MVESQSMLAAYKESINELDPGLIQRATVYVGILKDEYGLTDQSLESFMLPQVADIKFLNEMGFNMVWVPIQEMISISQVIVSMKKCSF